MASLARILAAATPVAFVGSVSWFGVLTYVNQYITRELGGSAEDWAVVSLAYNVSIMVWLLFVSDIAVRLGRRRTTAVAVLVNVLVFAGFAMTRSIVVIGVILVAAGFGQAVFLSTWRAMVSNAGGAKPGRALASTVLVGAVMGALSQIAGGRLIEQVGYEHSFLIIAVLCAVCAAAYWPLSRPLERAEQGGAVSLLHLTRRDWTALIAGPFAVIVFVGYTFEPFNFHTVNQLFANLADRVHGLSEAQIGDVTGFGRLPSVISVCVMMCFIDRAHPVRCYGLAVACVAVTVITMGCVGSPTTLGLTYGAYYLCHGMVWGTQSPAIAAAVEPRSHDVAFAIASFVASAATSGAGLVHLLMLRYGMSLPGVFVSSGLISLTAGTLLLVYSFTRHSRAAQAPRA